MAAGGCRRLSPLPRLDTPPGRSAKPTRRRSPPRRARRVDHPQPIDQIQAVRVPCRTDWRGKTQINVLILSFASEWIALPLVCMLLDKNGANSRAERIVIVLLEHVVPLLKGKRIKVTALLQ